MGVHGDEPISRLLRRSRRTDRFRDAVRVQDQRVARVQHRVAACFRPRSRANAPILGDEVVEIAPRGCCSRTAPGPRSRGCPWSPASETSAAGVPRSRPRSWRAGVWLARLTTTSGPFDGAPRVGLRSPALTQFQPRKASHSIPGGWKRETSPALPRPFLRSRAPEYGLCMALGEVSDVRQRPR